MSALPLIDPRAVLDEFGGEKRFRPFLDLLDEHNQKINLVSRETSKTGFRKLLADCLLPFSSHCPFGLSSGSTLGPAPGTLNILDVGSGGGFPGLVLAIALEVEITLVERIQKKARFLEFAIERLGLQGRVIPRDFESAWHSGGLSCGQPYSLATLRWVTLDKKLLRGFDSILESGATLVYYSILSDELAIDDSVWKLETFNYVFIDDQRAPRTLTRLIKL